MKLILDTNILLRATRDDDIEQTRIARRFLREAGVIAISSTVLCEFVWVMQKGYRRPRQEVYDLIAAIVAADNVNMDREAIGLGLRFMREGGDFADGVVASDGRRLGGTAFASFDKRARKLAAAAGFDVLDTST